MSNKTFSTDFLTDLEKVNVEAAVENTVLMDALKKVLMYGVLNQGVVRKEDSPNQNRNWAFGVLGDTGLSPEEKLTKMHAYAIAMSEIERAFHDMQLLRKQDDEKEKENLAR